MTNPVTQSELMKALDDLIFQEDKLDLLPDDITVCGLTKKTGWNQRRVVKVIAEWVEKGILEPLGERREPKRGHMVEAWRLKV